MILSCSVFTSTFSAGLMRVTVPEKEVMGRSSSGFVSHETERLYLLSSLLSSNSFTSVITGAKGVPV